MEIGGPRGHVNQAVDLYRGLHNGLGGTRLRSLMHVLSLQDPGI
jgi:hypothetical protein